MEFDLENPLTTIQDLHFDTDIVSLFSIENEHMPSQNYLLNLRTNGLDLTIRREAISLIFQVLLYFSIIVQYHIHISFSFLF